MVSCHANLKVSCQTDLYLCMWCVCVCTWVCKYVCLCGFMKRSREGYPVSSFIVLSLNQKLTSLSRLAASKFQKSLVSVTWCQGSGQAQPLLACIWVLRTAAQVFVLSQADTFTHWVIPPNTVLFFGHPLLVWEVLLSMYCFYWLMNKDVSVSDLAE